MRILVFFFVFITISYTQNTKTVDVVYLNDGGIIKGRIIEIIPNETIKIESSSGNVFVFKMSNVESIKNETIIEQNKKYLSYNQTYNPYKYKTQKNIGSLGLAAAIGLTYIGSLAMGDEMFDSTVLPLVGPFVTISRIEKDPYSDYLPGGKELLLTSGILQVSFFSYWVYYLVKDSDYKSKHRLSVIPNVNNIGFTFSYNF